jgi:hypothetical protein
MFIFGMGMIFLKDNMMVFLPIAVGGILLLTFAIFGWALEGPGGEMIDPTKESGAYN